MLLTEIVENENLRSQRNRNQCQKLEFEKREGGIWMVTKEQMPESDIKAELWSQEGRNYKD